VYGNELAFLNPPSFTGRFLDRLLLLFPHRSEFSYTRLVPQTPEAVRNAFPGVPPSIWDRPLPLGTFSSPLAPTLLAGTRPLSIPTLL